MMHVFICMDTIPDGLANSLCLNMMDQYAEVLTAFQPIFDIDHVTVGTNMDHLVELSKSSTSKWGLFFRFGNHVTFSFMRNIRNNFMNTDQNTAVIGHVLDRGDRYYELHDQAFILNLEKFRHTMGIGYTPRPGRKPAIKRSTENYHDGYTPKWVKPGVGYVDISDPAPGADLVAFGIQHGACRPFDDKERRGRFYMYPKDGFTDNLHKVEREISNTQTKFYLFNTDTELWKYPRDCNRVSRIVMPASGFLPFEMAREVQKTDDFKFVFFDTSATSQHMYRFMLDEWDGRDPRAIIERYITGPRAVVIDGRIEDLWNPMIDRFGGMSEWLSFFSAHRKQYHLTQMDIMTGYKSSNFTDHYDGVSGDVIYSLSNIYWYEPTSFLRSHPDRAESLNHHLDFMRTRFPDVWMYYSMPGVDYSMQAKNTPRYESLKFPWRNSGKPIDRIIDLY